MTDEELRRQHHNLLFAARRSVRYHMYRQRFLDRISDWGSVTTAVVGSATFAAFLTEQGWLPHAAGATALFSAFEVIFRPGRLARQHNELARDFIALEQEALRTQAATLTPKALLALQTRRLDIEAKEPPVYRVLDTICHDELVRALGHPNEQQSNVTWVPTVLKERGRRLAAPARQARHHPLPLARAGQLFKLRRHPKSGDVTAALLRHPQAVRGTAGVEVHFVE